MTILVPAKDGARTRALAVSVVLLALVWSIAPGKVQPDTKFNLVEEPWQYLLRSLFAWNDHAGLGELQNQAYGYLFPMGPVFGIGDLIGLPEWATQRLWWSLLILVGFWGAYRVALTLGGMASDIAIVVSLVYVFSPRLLSVLAQISVEAWPASIAPWLLLVAARMLGPGQSRVTRLRGAAWTALLVISLGGVNATASLAVLLLPFLWLVCAPRNDGPWKSLPWWFAGAILGAMWWLVPLFVLGGYGYPFLDYIETSRITTAVTSLSNALRGADHWIAYILDTAGHPVWQGGWVQAQYVLAIVTGSGVVAIAFFGLMKLRGHSEYEHLARFSYLSLLFGLTLVSIGYGGALASPFSTVIRDFLDGAGAPFRNVHKFDPLIRLPIALGVGYALTWLLSTRQRWSAPAVATVCLLALLSPTALWVGRAGDASAFLEVPHSWRATATFVDEVAEVQGGSTLVLPHARSADMTWGKVSDEPLSVLAQSPVTIRAAAPLGNPGGTRLLDDIDLAFGSGLRHQHLAELLNRMGIARIVLREDISPAILMHDVSQVEQTLRLSPGFELLSPAVAEHQVWAVGTASANAARLYAADELVTIAGVSEDLLGLMEQGFVTDRSVTAIQPTLIKPDITTDGFRWQLWNSGLLPAWGTSELQSVNADGPYRIGARTLPPDGRADEHVTRDWQGISKFSASSTAADPFGTIALGPGFALSAAIDGDAQTHWWSDFETSSWVQLSWTDPTDLGVLSFQLTAPTGFRLPKFVELQVTDETGALSTLRQVPNADSTVEFNLQERLTSKVRLVFPTSNVKTIRGISEIRSSNVSFGSLAKLPQKVDFTDTILSLAAEDTGAATTQVGRYGVRRQPEALGTETWSVELQNAQAIATRISVQARPGASLEKLLDGGTFYSEQRISAAPSTRPGASFDGDPETSWRVPAEYTEATVQIGWDRIAAISGIHSAKNGSTIRIRSADGLQRLPAGGGSVQIDSDSLELTFTKPKGLRGSDDWSVPETKIVGAPQMPEHIKTDCGAITATLGSNQLKFRINTDRTSLVHDASVPAEVCGNGRVSLGDGATQIAITTEDYLRWKNFSLGLDSEDSEVASTTWQPVMSTKINPTRHEYVVEALNSSVLAIPHGFNTGWVAEGASGKSFEATIVDGWQQGFVIPHGTNEKITVRFAPQTAHVAGLLLGPLVAGLALIVLLKTRGRRNETQTSHDELESSRAGAFAHSRVFLYAATFLVGFMFSGLAGLLITVGVLLIPRRSLVMIGTSAMAASGLALAFLGVVDHASLGAMLGQMLALIAVLILVRSWFSFAPNARLVSPPNTTTLTQ